MGTFRLYTRPDGQGRIETIDIEKKADWLKGLPTTQISFSVWPVGQFLDWHPAPRRQFVIILQGQLEIGLGDGSKHVFGPGDARLVEDTTGKGHTTRVVGNDPCLTATIPLAQQYGDQDPVRAEATRRGRGHRSVDDTPGVRADRRRSGHPRVLQGGDRRRVLPGPRAPDGRRVFPLGAEAEAGPAAQRGL